MLSGGIPPSRLPGKDMETAGDVRQDGVIASEVTCARGKA